MNNSLDHDLPPDDEPDIAWGPSRERLDNQSAPPHEVPPEHSSPLKLLVKLVRDCMGVVHDRK